MTPRWLRDRVPYLALAAGTIALGLAVHLRGAWLAPGARDVLGDALWATMMAWWMGVLVPRAPLAARAAAALAISFMVEASQTYHAAAIDTVRRTTMGRLILGTDFDPRDLLAYTLGVLAAVAVEWLIRGRRGRGMESETRT